MTKRVIYSLVGVKKMTDILDRLEQIKHSKNYTFYELAKKLGFPPTTISRWIYTKKINPFYKEQLKQRIESL